MFGHYIFILEYGIEPTRFVSFDAKGFDGAVRLYSKATYLDAGVGAACACKDGLLCYLAFGAASDSENNEDCIETGEMSSCFKPKASVRAGYYDCFAGEVLGRHW